MEAKKSPSKDIHRMSNLFFQAGLCISVALVIAAFEWKTETPKVRLRIIDEQPLEITQVPITDIIPPTPPSPIQNDIVANKKLFNPIIELVSNQQELTPDIQPNIDQGEIILPTITYEPDIPEDCKNCIVTFPEKQAEPIGGYQAFYKILRDNLRYPSKARKFNVEGKIFLEFVVNRDGSPSEAKIIRGLGYGCDEEAIRVIGLSKWNPGLQRGRSVRVKMVLPIVFQLN